MNRLDVTIAALLEHETAMGILSDIVNHGRLVADDLPHDDIVFLTRVGCLQFLAQKRDGRAVRLYAYPSQLGLRVFATLEREADRQA